MAVIPLPSVSHLAVVSIILYGIYYLRWQWTIGASRRRMIQEHGCQPPRSVPELDTFASKVVALKFLRENLQAYQKRALLEVLTQRYAKFGNTISTKMMFSKTIMTIDPENLKAVLATNFKDWNLPDQRKSAFIPLLGHGIFTSDGPAWQQSRDLMRPNFNRGQVGNLKALEVHVDHLLQAIPRDGSTVDLQELFFRLTIDSATEFLFGESVGSLAPGISKKSDSLFAAAFNRSQEVVGQEVRSLGFSAMLPRPQFQQDIKYVHAFADRYVQQGLDYRKTQNQDKDEGERYIFLHELAKVTDDPKRIRDELLNILLAGRDTTAGLLSNVWFVLAKRPDIWEKLRVEVDDLGGELPTYEQIKDMKYLRALLNESLRLHPVVPANSRMAIADTILPRGGGPDGMSPLFVPKETLCFYSVYAMHRRKDFYGEDAEEFKPERWETLRPGWEYLPFNGGPRICIGQQFALTEASYATVRLMQEFKVVESRDPEPWVEYLNITCASFNGTKVALIPG